MNMKKLNILLFALIFILLVIVMSNTKVWINTHSDSEETPEQFITKAFDYFNQESNEQMNGLSSSPFFVIMGEKTTLFDGYGDAINFDGIKEDGWVSTQINRLTVLYENKESALVTVDFSRVNGLDVAYSTSLGHYLLVKQNNLWKLKGALFLGDLSLGEV